MVESVTFVVTEDVARRSGVIATRYRTEDGRFILNNRDLRGVRMTAEELQTGLQGIERISDELARQLIKKGGYKMGLPGSDTVGEVPALQQQEEPSVDVVETASPDEPETESETPNVEETED